MKTISKFDKLLLLGVALIVIGIFVLAFVIAFKGGECAINPCGYAVKNNISCYNPYTIGFPRSEECRGGKECRCRWSPYH